MSKQIVLGTQYAFLYRKSGNIGAYGLCYLIIWWLYKSLRTAYCSIPRDTPID